MRKITTFLILCLIASKLVFADDRYWVGPFTGNWNNSANWSQTSHGPGGASVPGLADSVIIDENATVNMDVSPSVRSLRIGVDVSTNDYKVTLYTATGSVLTIMNNFFVHRYFTLYDSTSENVVFKVVFNGATHATASVEGPWFFSGRVPVTGGAGATFTAEPGSFVNVKFYITSGKNSAPIVSDSSTLKFDLQSAYVMENNMDATIPDATWTPDYIVYADIPVNPRPIIFSISGASIGINGSLGRLKHSKPKPSYRSLSVYLNNANADASLALPDGTTIGTLSVFTTNGHSVTLLDETGSSSRVSAKIGNVSINGENTQVALARATSAAPQTSYFLQVNYFTQTDGNFSLQDYNDPQGSSTLAVLRDMKQTGGTFFTKSTTTNFAAKFVLEMNGPEFIYNRPFGIASSGQILTMSSGTIDNGRNMVTLRINNELIGSNGYFFVDVGVTLKSRLKVGKLELLKGTLNTTDTSLISVADPDLNTGIVTGKMGESYVVGPLSRMTNSSNNYILPIGKNPYSNIHEYFRPVTIRPSSNAISEYKAEYFDRVYSDLGVIAPLKGVSNKEYWNISKISGADASITLPLIGKIPSASAADGIVVAHYVNNHWISEQGTILTPGTADSGSVTSKPLSVFSPFTLGYKSMLEDSSIQVLTCLKDTSFLADPSNCKAKISWVIPQVLFPPTLNSTGGDLRYKGTFEGHGYYESLSAQYWPQANEIAVAAGAHLVTITSAAENSFILNKVINRQEPAFSWIGLQNIGKAGQFGWVTGEPLSYTNWMPGEPNNLYGLNNPNPFIYEPYVQINPYDSLYRWNDNSYIEKARYLAEFDSALITCRQFSGPANGSIVDPGIYSVCYEIINRESGKHDTCCFNITVLCQNPVATDCPKDTTLLADAATCMAMATWTIPQAVFGDSYNIGQGDQLKLKGIFNGHGYYESGLNYYWPEARDIASNAGGHLVTISSATEDSFIVNKVTNREQPAYSWIGLRNSGKAGDFSWVTGEPVVYTNWMPGEPNNLYGLNNTDPTIFEPYVHINPYDVQNRWNDNNANLTARLLAEFENPTISYRQYSGPSYGSTLMPGVYTVCYEITNQQNNIKDSCCFKITVVCSQPITSTANGGNVSKASSTFTNSPAFIAVAYPNPSSSYFTIKLNANDASNRIKMQVTDVTGRIMEVRENIGTGKLLQLGSEYKTGVYFIKVMQGSRVITMKLVKK